MYTEVVKYTDYKGNEREEEINFNLSPAEITDMEMSKAGGLGESLKKIIAAKDSVAIATVFKDIFLKAYGVISDDGKRFMKSPEIVEAFVQTEAYTNLYMSLMFDQGKMEKFINSVIPDMTVYENKIEELKRNADASKFAVLPETTN